MIALPYRYRLCDGYLASLLHEFPAVMINGARAIGKTTTAAQHVGHIVRLDEPGVAATYRADPDAALRRADRPVLLDEWQEVPQVLAAVKRVVDRDATPGQFILTGSVRAELTNETWAGTGRTVRMNMFSLTERELTTHMDTGQPTFLQRLAASGIDDLNLPPEMPDINDYITAAVRGGFPEVAYRDRSESSRSIWLTSYLDDLITRDAAMLDSTKDPAKLRHYLGVLALNNAGMPADATLYRAAGINARTAAAYDQLLRNLYVLDIVPAWANGRLNRLVKTGKRYMVDSGLAAAAANLTTEIILDDSDLVGRFFDAFATAQIRPEAGLVHPRPALHHLRTAAGRQEIDLVIELGATRVVGIEFKAGSAPTADDAKHLSWLRDELGQGFTAGAVLHSGPGIYPLGDRIYAIPLCALWG